MPAFDLEHLSEGLVYQVAKHARSCDQQEIGACQPDGYDPAALADEMVRGCAHGFVAMADGDPVAVVGLCLVMPGVYSAGMFATDRWADIAFPVTKFIRTIFIPERRAEGMRRMEVRSIADHPLSGHWLEHLGFVREATCPDFGMRGETFHLYAWRLSDQQAKDGARV